MDKQLITILIVAYNVSAFVEVSLYGLAKLTKNKYKVIICDNGSPYFEKKRLKRIVSKYANTELFFRKQSAPGSMGHGEALNILIDKIDTPYGVILDADATFLKRGWDEILVNQLDDEVKIIGATLIRNPIRPTDFPSIFAALFDTKVFKSLRIDMRPKNIKDGQDVGWEMRGKFLKNGYQGKVLETRSTREYKNGPFRDVICAEYYFKGYDSVFACHFGRGSSLGAAKYKEWNRFFNFPLTKRIAMRIKGYRERKQWLTICREIIDKETRRRVANE